MKLDVFVCTVLSTLVRFSAGQEDSSVSDRGLIHRRRPLVAAGAASSPCGEDFRSAADDPDSRTLALLGGAAVGGVLGGVAGYHLGMKNGKPVIINNNVYNQLPSPCYNIPVQVTAGSPGGGGGHPGGIIGGGGYPGNGGGGLLGGNGLVGGILSNHPILSNILSGGGGLLSNGLGQNFASNRDYRQFQRQIVRPLSRLLK